VKRGKHQTLKAEEKKRKDTKSETEGEEKKSPLGVIFRGNSGQYGRLSNQNFERKTRGERSVRPGGKGEKGPRSVGESTKRPGNPTAKGLRPI